MTCTAGVWVAGRLPTGGVWSFWRPFASLLSLPTMHDLHTPLVRRAPTMAPSPAASVTCSEAPPPCGWCLVQLLPAAATSCCTLRWTAGGSWGARRWAEDSVARNQWGPWKCGPAANCVMQGACTAGWGHVGGSEPALSPHRTQPSAPSTLPTPPHPAQLDSTFTHDAVRRRDRVYVASTGDGRVLELEYPSLNPVRGGAAASVVQGLCGAGRCYAACSA